MSIIHLPNAQVGFKNTGFLGSREDASWVIEAKAMPTQENRTYEIQFSTEALNPEVMAALFGDASLSRPLCGVTINTNPFDVRELSLSDHSWALTASRIRYEWALESARVDKLFIL